MGGWDNRKKIISNNDSGSTRGWFEFGGGPLLVLASQENGGLL